MAGFACNHLDVHRPFPHLARDDTLVLRIGAPSLMLLAVHPRRRAWRGPRRAGGGGQFQARLRVCASPSVVRRRPPIVRGEADMTRVEPRGAYGAPSSAFADLGCRGPPPSERPGPSPRALSRRALYAWNFHFQPARGKGGRASPGRRVRGRGVRRVRRVPDRVRPAGTGGRRRGGPGRLALGSRARFILRRLPGVRAHGGARRAAAFHQWQRRCVGTTTLAFARWGS